MSNEIDRRVVEMQFDNKQFEEGIHTSVESLDKLKKSLDLEDSSKSLSKLERTSKHFNMKSVTEAADAVSHRFTLLGNLTDTVFTRISNTVINTFSKIKQLVDEFTIDPIMSGMQEYETQINSVQTILANTRDAMTKQGLGDQERLDLVNSKLDELNHYADKTIYNFTQMTESIGRFTAAGVELEPSVNAIQGIANLAALSGANAEQASNAMYMLSQAISTGQTQLYHWNSIVRASMGGEITQQALMKVADSMHVTVDRTVEEVDSSGKKIKKSVKRTVQELMDIEGMSFRDTLQTGWLTGDVWTKTLELFAMDFEELSKKTHLDEQQKQSLIEEYTKKFIGEGNDAETALQKAKRIVEEATDLTIEQAKAVKKAQLIAEGFSDTEADWFISLAEEGVNAATKVKTFTQLFDTLREAAQSGWTQSWEYILGDFYEAREFFTSLSDFFGDLIGRSADARNELLKQWREGGGRDLLINNDPNKGPLGALWNLIYGFQNIAQTIRSGIRKIIPPMTGEMLVNITQKINDLTAKFREFTENADIMEKFQRIVAGVASAFGIVRDALSAVWGTITRVVAPLGSISGNFLEFVASIGDWITNLREKIQDSEAVQTFLNGISIAMEKIKTIAVSTYTSISNWFKAIKESEALPKIITKIQEAFGKVSKWFKSIGVDSIKGFFQGILNAMKSAGTWLKTNLVDPIVNWVKNLLGIHSPSTVFAKIGTWIVEGLWVGIKNGWHKIVEFFKTSLDNLTSFFGNFHLNFGEQGTRVRDVFGSWMDTIKEALVNAWEKVKGFFVNFFSVTVPNFFNQPWVQTVIDKIKNVNWGAIATIIIGAFSGLAIVKAVKTIIGIGSAVKKLTKSVTGLGKGLTKFFNSGAKITKITKNKDSIGTNMLKIAAAIGILVASIYVLANMKVEDVKKGGIILSILAAALLSASFLFSKVQIDGKSFQQLAVALILLTASVMAFAAMPWTTSVKGLFFLGLLLTELGLFSRKIGSTIKMKGFFSLGVAILLLTGSVKKLGTMDIDAAIQGVLGLGLILTELGLFIKKTNGAKDLPKLKGLSFAVAILAVAVKLLSTMEIRGAIQGVIGLGIIMFELQAFAGAMTGKETKGLFAMTAAIAVLAVATRALGKMSTSSLAKGIGAIAVLMLAFGAMMTLTKGTSIVKSATVVLTLAGTLYLFVKAIRDVSNMGIDPDFMVDFSTSFSLMIVALSKSFSLLSLIPLHETVRAIANFALIIAAVGGIAIGLGALKNNWDKWSVVSTYLKDGGEVLGDIGSAIGQFIGGLTGGFFRRLIDLPQLGTDLSGFMTNASGFVSGAKNIDRSVLTGVSNLAGSLLVISGTEFLDSLNLFENVVGHFTGSSEYDRFAEHITSVGKGIGQYAEAIKPLSEIPEGTFNRSIAAATSLSGVLLIISTSEFLSGISSLFSFLSGKNSMQQFVTDIGVFSEGLVSFGNKLAEMSLDEADIAKINAMTELAMTLSNLQNTLEAQGGYQDLFEGVRSLSVFGNEIPTFAVGLNKFVTEVKAITYDSETDKKKIDDLIGFAVALSELENSLVAQGGKQEAYEGVRSLSVFSSGFEPFAQGLNTFISEAKSIQYAPEDSQKINNLISIGVSLAELERNLEPQGGEVDEKYGVKSLITFSKEMKPFAQGLNMFVTEAKSINYNKDTDSGTFEGLLGLATDLSDFEKQLAPKGNSLRKMMLGEQDLAVFGQSMAVLAGGLNSYVNGILNVDVGKSDEAIGIMNSIIGLIEGMRRSGSIFQDFGKQFLGSQEETLISYSATMSVVGANIGNFCNSLVGINTENAESAFGVIDRMLSLFDTTKKSGGRLGTISEFFNGTSEATILSYTATMVTVGSRLKTFADDIQGTDYSKTQDALDVVSVIKEFTSTLDKSGGFWQGLVSLFTGDQTLTSISQDLASFGSNFNQFGISISGAAGVLNNFAFVKAILQSFGDLAKAYQESEIDDFSIQQTAGLIGSAFDAAFIRVIQDGADTISAAEAVVMAIDASTIDQAYNDWYNSGRYIAEGLAKGMTSMCDYVAGSAMTLADTTVKALRYALEIHSPSKRMEREAGIPSMQGYANTFTSNAAKRYTNRMTDRYIASTVTHMKASLNSYTGGGGGVIDTALGYIEPVVSLVSGDAMDVVNQLWDGSSKSTTTGPNGNPVGEEIGSIVDDNLNAIASSGGVVVNFNDKNLVERLNSIEDRIVELTELIDTMQMVLDTGELVGAMASKMDSELGTLSMRRGRGQ